MDAQAPVRGFGIEQHASAAAALGPVHRTDVQLRLGIEAGDSLASEAQPCCGIDYRLQLEIDRGLIDPRTMAVEIGRDPLERARAVKHRGRQPRRMGARTHDRHIALVPVPSKEGPGLRIADGFYDRGHCCHPRGSAHNSGYYCPNSLRISLPIAPARAMDSRLTGHNGTLHVSGPIC